jgi:hypothetical protein
LEAVKRHLSACLKIHRDKPGSCWELSSAGCAVSADTVTPLGVWDRPVDSDAKEGLQCGLSVGGNEHKNSDASRHDVTAGWVSIEPLGMLDTWTLDSAVFKQL